MGIHKVEVHDMEQKYVEQAVELALEEYKIEYSKNSQLMNKNFEKELLYLIEHLFINKYGKVAVKDGRVIGYLAFGETINNLHGNAKGVFSPLGGSAFTGNNRSDIALKLLQDVMKDLVAGGISSFAISRYANDEEVGKALVLNGFGIRCSDGIMNLKKRSKIAELSETIIFQEICKEDKREISSLEKGLLEHLRSSPIFLPADMFEEDDKNSGIRTIIAKKEDKVIGYMELDVKAETFISSDENIYNICGAYIDKEYRNKGVAQQLLEYVCQICEEEGKEYLGVDCETLNLNALKFWGKYFENYTYGYARRIDERIL